MDLKRRLSHLLGSLAKLNFDTRPLVFEAPASEQELLEVERQLGARIPSSFRGVLAFVSSHVEFRWFAPRELRFPEPFHQNFSGDLHWSLSLLLQYEREKKGWIESVFKNPNDPYDGVWHNKLAFQEVGNGDYLALDLSPASSGEIVYLSHDDGRGHGHVLAPSFAELLERWVPLGCPGADDWQWSPFTGNLSGPIDPQSASANRWRELLLGDV